MLYISRFDPFKYIKGVLYKAEVKDDFDKITILKINWLTEQQHLITLNTCYISSG